jgi:hypothetical protein
MMNVGGRGAMSASGGMMADEKLLNLTITDERPASGDAMRAYFISKLQSVADFPELEGQIYNQLHSVTMAKISGSTAGAYSASEKKIIIDSRLSPAKARAVAAHELGHALAKKPPKGFRSDVDAFKMAYNEYRKTHSRATEASFAARISNYATNSRGEAFAEAFKDVSINGKSAKAESKLIMGYWKK